MTLEAHEFVVELSWPELMEELAITREEAIEFLVAIQDLEGFHVLQEPASQDQGVDNFKGVLFQPTIAANAVDSLHDALMLKEPGDTAAERVSRLSRLSTLRKMLPVLQRTLHHKYVIIWREEIPK